jgi:hypothetical protein
MYRSVAQLEVTEAALSTSLLGPLHAASGFVASENWGISVPPMLVALVMSSKGDVELLLDPPLSHWGISLKNNKDPN